MLGRKEPAFLFLFFFSSEHQVGNHERWHHSRVGVPAPSWAPETVVEAELEVTDWGVEWGPGVMRRSAQLNACGCGIPCQAPEFTHSFSKYLLSIYHFPCGSAGKESACNVGDLGLIPGLGRSPGEGNGYPLQYSGLENSMNCIVHGVTKSQTRLSDFHFAYYVLIPGDCWSSANSP